MSRDETRAVMEAYTSAGANLKDLIAEDAVYHDVRTGKDFRGHAAISEMFATYYERVFQADAVLRHAVVGDAWFACEYEMTGTHVGEFEGVAGSGKPFSADFAVFYRVADGKVAAARIYFPGAQVLRQVKS